MADDLKPCSFCGGRGYFHCECWPADCICGGDYEPCEECGGDGFFDPYFAEQEEAYWREMEARVALRLRPSIQQDAPEAQKPDPKKARRRALVKAARKQKHGGKRNG